MGCLKSHIRALRLAKEKRFLWTAVFEDDFEFDYPGEDVRARIRFVPENSALAPVWMGDWNANGPQPSKHSLYPDIKLANGTCTASSCYFVRHDYTDVLLGTWETALANLVIDLRRGVEDKRSNVIEEIGELWWYSADTAWAPLQIRDQWLLFEPQVGYQNIAKFGSIIGSSITNFEETGFLDVAPDEITTDIA